MKPFRVFRIKGKALVFFIFCMVLVYLAGSYFGGIMLFLLYSLLLLPFLSLIHLILAIVGIKYFQYFSTDHPVKGESIHYRIILANESLFSISDISSKFTKIHPFMHRMIPDFRLSLKRKETREFTYEITCSYRGIYNVGLDTLFISDMLDFITIAIPVWHRTFYVYPRILSLHHFSFGIESLLGKGTDAALAGIPDHTLIKGTHEYKAGLPLRHIYWKKYAATGLPVLKEYDTSATPEVALYLDLFNEDAEVFTINSLEREDVSIEILTALVHYYLNANVRLTVRCPSNPIFSFKGNLIEHFEDFYRQTINLFSGPNQNPYSLFRIDMKHGELESKSIIFITHRISADLFNFLEESINTDLQVMVIFNHTASDEDMQRQYGRFFNTLRDRGARIVEVRSPQTIQEDLEHYGKNKAF
jgi:hypothetical protein